MNRICGTNLSKTMVVALLGCVAALVTGCTTSQFLSGTDVEPVSGMAIHGVVHGGQNPVTGATVQLWTVGTGGYGSAASPLGSSVQTLAGGGFTIGTYTCPSSSAQIYITSSGGDPGLGTGANANIMLAAALGSCSGIASDYIVINEVTTAATAYALGQYFTTTFGSASTDSFGAPAATDTQAQTGLTNAFATVNNLVNIATGSATTATNLPANCTSSSTYCVTMTPETTKLNTIADILAACVNSAGGTAGDTTSCGQLFAEVKTTSGLAPTDTLQAAVYMSLNPTSTNSNSTFPTNCTAPPVGSPTPNNLCALFSLVQGGGAPFTAGSQPTDWTVGIAYTDITTAQSVLTAPLALAVDGSGNVWVGNDLGGTADGSLGELSPTGTPVFGSIFPDNTGTSTLAAAGIRNIAVDLSGNIWLATSGGSSYVYDYTPGTNPVSTVVPTAHLSKSSWGLTIDGNNDVFVTEQSSSAVATANIYEFPAGVITNEVEYPEAVSGTEMRGENLAIDATSAHNLWIDSGSNNNTILQLSDITPCTPSGGPPATCTVTSSGSSNVYTTESVGTVTTPQQFAAAPGGIWFANLGVPGLTFLPLTGSTVGTPATYGGSTNLSKPQFIAVDGAGNVWTEATNETSPASIQEVSSTGTVLSPSNTGNSPFNIIGFSHVGLTTGAGIAVDPSGNVWVADNLATGSTSGASVFELVGAAAPTVTPVVQALKNGTVGAKP